MLGAVKNGMSRAFAPAIVESGAVYIDNSSAFRLDPDVPLVVPEINGEDAFTNKGIIANPNCSSTITLMAVAGLAKLSPIKSMVACTYQAVSGAGQKGFDELEGQMRAVLAGEKTESSVFPTQIAMNVIPFIGEELENLYTDEEIKMQNEGRRILHLPALKVSCTCVRVPVMRSHSISVTVRTERKISVEEARDAVRAYPGCRLVEDWPGPQLSHAPGHQQSGSGLGWPYKGGFDRRKGPHSLVLRRSDQKRRRQQRCADPQTHGGERIKAAQQSLPRRRARHGGGGVAVQRPEGSLSIPFCSLRPRFPGCP